MVISILMTLTTAANVLIWQFGSLMRALIETRRDIMAIFFLRLQLEKRISENLFYYLSANELKCQNINFRLLHDTKNNSEKNPFIYSPTKQRSL